LAPRCALAKEMNANRQSSRSVRSHRTAAARAAAAAARLERQTV
jgi:hypothetical protein